MRSSSPIDIFLGSQITPPLAPPNGIFTMAHFQVIQLARARTSSRVTSGAYRIPPLAGPRAIECCTRKPVKTSSFPLSIETGMWTINSRLGYWRTFQRPSSKLSFCAAKLKRADCASQGLISCSRETVFINSPNYGQLTASEDEGLAPARKLSDFRQRQATKQADERGK